jgi:tetratricopeptide (TPR) repeat protein
MSTAPSLLLQRPATADDEQALVAYQTLLALNPNRASTHYNIGLIYKYRGQWAEALHHSQRAAALDPVDEATQWNLAIAATALHDWVTARAAWQRLGLDVTPGDTPIDGAFGTAAVELHPDRPDALVWGQRIDPVRLRIAHDTGPAAPVQRGDVLLHDGAVLGRVKIDDQVLPVFKGLAVHQRATAAHDGDA